MRALIAFVAVVAAFGQAAAFGQESLGYAFVGGTFGGRGSVDGAFRFGIGGEMGIAPRVTLGGEIGGISKDGTGVLASGNVSYHIPADSRAADPFVTGGFSLAHKRGETGLYINLGGGLNYWLRRRAGIRVEFRGYPGGYDLNSFAEFRIGIVFR
jgi:hypothetical protein